MPRPRLITLATGGTIAMTKETAPGGAATTLCAENLVAAVPHLAELAEVEALDVLAKPSADFTLADIAAIADAATAAAKKCAGVVITHGTDTLEESAFALSLLVQVESPIVFTAAMRRLDQPSADGPARPDRKIACKRGGPSVLVRLVNETGPTRAREKRSQILSS